MTRKRLRKRKGDLAEQLDSWLLRERITLKQAGQILGVSGSTICHWKQRDYRPHGITYREVCLSVAPGTAHAAGGAAG